MCKSYRKDRDALVGEAMGYSMDEILLVPSYLGRFLVQCAFLMIKLMKSAMPMTS
jgi:hypothetical protein